MYLSISILCLSVSLLVFPSTLIAVEKIEGYKDIKLGMTLTAFIETHPHFQSLDIKDGWLKSIQMSSGSGLYPETKEEWDYIETVKAGRKVRRVATRQSKNFLRKSVR